MGRSTLERIFLNLLRIMTGFLFFQHGAQKLWGWFGADPVEFLELRFFAGVIEFFGGILILLGLGTRGVAFVAAGLMASALFISHFPRGFWPIENGGSLAALYCFVFLYLVARGGGGFSIDGLLAQKATREAEAERAPPV